MMRKDQAQLMKAIETACVQAIRWINDCLDKLDANDILEATGHVLGKQHPAYTNLKKAIQDFDSAKVVTIADLLDQGRAVRGVKVVTQKGTEVREVSHVEQPVGLKERVYLRPKGYVAPGGDFDPVPYAPSDLLVVGD